MQSQQGVKPSRAQSDDNEINLLSAIGMEMAAVTSLAERVNDKSSKCGGERCHNVHQHAAVLDHQSHHHDPTLHTTPLQVRSQHR